LIILRKRDFFILSWGMSFSNSKQLSKMKTEKEENKYTARRTSTKTCLWSLDFWVEVSTMIQSSFSLLTNNRLNEVTRGKFTFNISNYFFHILFFFAAKFQLHLRTSCFYIALNTKAEVKLSKMISNSEFPWFIDAKDQLLIEINLIINNIYWIIIIRNKIFNLKFFVLFSSVWTRKYSFNILKIN
jgi:hypothetical protein